jgi:hypothetical protein
MEPADELTSDNLSYCFVAKDDVYVIYLPMELETTSIDLGNSKESYSVKWYNPRDGGELLEGTQQTIKAEGKVEVGKAPAETQKDWVVIIQKI